MPRTISKKKLDEKLRILELEDDQQTKEVVCSLIGHSRIQTTCMGYFYCARCGARVGDALGSIYPEASSMVLVGHDCETCRENYESCSWRDKYLVTVNPFTGEDV